MGSLPDSKYIIQTDGYWFVEAHDVDPSKGYITVSAKGIVNGLSNQPNDGADFGPDSYNPSYSGSGIPYTSTSGIQEGLDYVKAQNGGTLRIFTGVYTINTAIAYSIDDPSQGGISIIGAQINEETNAIGGVRIEPGDNFTSGAYLMTFGKDTTVQLNVDIENLYFYGGKNGSTSAFASGINLQNIGTFYSKNLTFSYCVVGKYLQKHSNIGIINGVTNIQDVFNYCNTGIINEYTSSFYTPQFFNCVLPIQEQGLLGTAYYSPT